MIVLTCQPLPSFLFSKYLTNNSNHLIYSKYQISILNQYHYDGVFCSDDLTALLTINVAKQLSIDVPKDLRIVGYDGTSLVRNYNPGLTTVAQPLVDISTLLVSLLLQRIDDQDCGLEKEYVLPVKLIKGITA